MEITYEARRAIVFEVIEDLRKFGHQDAVRHVRSALSRMSLKEAEREKANNVVQHRTVPQAADDAAGQMAREERPEASAACG